MKIKKYGMTLSIIMFIFFSCRKFIQVDTPSQLLTTSNVYANPNNAESVLAKAYFNLADIYTQFYSGWGCLGLAMSSDELVPYNPNDNTLMALYTNEFVTGNSFVNDTWASSYQTIYAANSIIENVHQTNFRDSIKNELLGQAHFLRAFCNFYLVNLFGDIPLVTTTNWQQSKSLSRSKTPEVYQLILSDLEFASEHLQTNYNTGKGERIVPNRFAAEALLARVYLYLENWERAEAYANDVIKATDFFSLVAPNDIEKPNNKEAIWQLKQFSNGRYYSQVGRVLIPRQKNSNIGPLGYFPSTFLTSFETGDLRKLNWIDSTTITTSGNVFYYPYKFKTNESSALSSYSEYQTMLRLAELLLIRSEARLETNQLALAAQDLNMVRKRAGLPNITFELTKTSLKEALIKERRFELFAEWGHRWLDLKRWGIAGSVLKLINEKKWEETDLLFPIPGSDLLMNPNITQNPGYNF